MNVSELIDILKKVDPDKEVFVMDDHSIYSAQSVEIAETGNLILSFDNWYNEYAADCLINSIDLLLNYKRDE